MRWPLALAMIILAMPCWAEDAPAWSELRTAAPGPARVVGRVSAGCLAGAVALPIEGDRYRLAYPERHRHFGHPTLVAFIQQLARTMAKRRLGILVIGDMSQPRGGPVPGGHSSHQSGLDVDLWYVASGDPIVDPDKGTRNKHWNKTVVRRLRLIAEDSRVDRMFVNPVIKQQLCRMIPAAERGWLRKVSPWWGHDRHVHVRLRCPRDSPDCVAQAALPEGDGCDALSWWFDKAAQAARAKQRARYRENIAAPPPLPAACQQLLAF